MIRGVIFDLGGTLVYSAEFEAANAQALTRWLRARGYTVPDEFAPAVMEERRARWAARRGTEEVTAHEALQAVLERYGLPADAAFVADAERAFFGPELEGMRPRPGATALLARLAGAGLALGLISNASSHYLIVACCRRLLFEPYLDPIVVSAAVGWRKPDPRLFRIVLRHWNLEASQVVMVGDSLEADIAGAQAVGMRSILVTPEPDGRPSAPPDPAAVADVRPDAVAADLRQVEAIIDRWREEP
ncbi:MAG: HAD family hydrolase [Armatimonadota bacterium]|nr:HAD family hydrolase [Armatimonadota bacterium]MDR7451699.1 HAD family hydrolase [Armatimonadota bacterium]MDR7465683.1 HAD family hydrolase [Armatimonadota bacterium]MDR7493592.1 HAD family hydrolase [Armatimonadota bacterium]MDR7499504.1 HAD family hydrolase [Armatimonadota bacterium]